MKRIKTLKGMALMAAIVSALIACNQVTSGDPVEEGLTGPAASSGNIGDKAVGQPTNWLPLPVVPFVNTSVSPVTTINGISSDGTNFVAIAGDGTMGYGSLTTNNGLTSWNAPIPLPGFTRNPSTINYLNGNYLVTAGNTLTAGARSVGGTSWASTGTIGFGSKASAYGTAESLYVVGGQNGQAAYAKALGTNFVTIPQTTTGWTGTGPTAYINAGAYGQGLAGPMYVFGGGSGRIAYTPTILNSSGSLNTWQTAKSPFGTGEFINVIVYGADDKTFVTVGGPNNGPGKAAYSQDGIAWIQATNFLLGNGVAVYALAYGGGYFVAGDDAGNIAYSPDGASWFAPIKVFQGGDPINAITYGNGRFIAVGGTSAPVAAYALWP
ncbi:hypothetical protein Holit_02311 [Hollandina sp. SP2]